MLDLNLCYPGRCLVCVESNDRSEAGGQAVIASVAEAYRKAGKTPIDIYKQDCINSQNFVAIKKGPIKYWANPQFWKFGPRLNLNNL